MAWIQPINGGTPGRPQPEPRRPEGGSGGQPSAANRSSIPLYGQPFIQSHGELEQNMRAALRRSQEAEPEAVAVMERLRPAAPASPPTLPPLPGQPQREESAPPAPSAVTEEGEAPQAPAAVPAAPEPELDEFTGTNWYGDDAPYQEDAAELPHLELPALRQNASPREAELPPEAKTYHNFHQLCGCLGRKQPGRVLHSKGAGLFGTFQPTASMAEYTTADFLQRPGESTRVLLRISSMLGHKGTPDTKRGPKGLAFKFYTGQGNYDVLALNLPVTLLRDAAKLPELVRALQPDPRTHLTGGQRLWALAAETPDMVHFLLRMFGDHGLVKDYHRMDGHGLGTYVWQNAAGQRRYVRYHFLCADGWERVEPEEAVRLAGEDPDCAHSSLYRRVAAGDSLRYTFSVQMTDPDQARSMGFDPLDSTKVWPKAQFPMTEVGALTFDQIPDDYVTQVELAAFHPATLVPGIALSEDPLLQGGLYAYTLAQQNRLGGAAQRSPVNAPIAVPVPALGEGGAEMSAPRRHGGDTATLAEQPLRTPLWLPKEAEGGEIAVAGANSDPFGQAAEYFHSLCADAKCRLFTALGAELARCEQEVQQGQLRVFHQVSPELSLGVHEGIRRAMSR